MLGEQRRFREFFNPNASSHATIGCVVPSFRLGFNFNCLVRLDGSPRCSRPTFNTARDRT